MGFELASIVNYLAPTRFSPRMGELTELVRGERGANPARRPIARHRNDRDVAMDYARVGGCVERIAWWVKRRPVELIIGIVQQVAARSPGDPRHVGAAERPVCRSFGHDCTLPAEHVTCKRSSFGGRLGSLGDALGEQPFDALARARLHPPRIDHS